MRSGPRITPEGLQGHFGQWRRVITKDGPTLWSAFYDETCHSSDGARGETDLYYVKGCQILERVNQAVPFPLFEMGFGWGLGYERTVAALTRPNQFPSSFPPIFYLAVEKEENLIQWGQQYVPSEVPTSSPYPRRQDLAPSLWHGLPAYSAQSSRGELVVLLGDARKQIPRLLALKKEIPQAVPSFWAIYQDAFSPRKNPELWTVEWFEQLRELAHPQCRLSTFSASSRIRKSLIAAQWKVQLGERFGPKRASTLAVLEGETSPEILSRLQRSPVEALTDSLLSEKGSLHAF